MDFEILMRLSLSLAKRMIRNDEMNKKNFLKVLEYVKSLKLVEPGDKIIAGVSGGADSMCMLQMLIELKRHLDFELIVSHVNHGIRGEEAERDAEFVEGFCTDNGLKFELANADVPKLSKEMGTSLEEAGRDFRYRFFLELALKYGANKIAVAHNSDDNAETVLFNIFRGSGIGGLKGILPKRDIKAKDGSIVTLIRPVLILSRQEIEEFLKEIGQTYCTDSTNCQEEYSRNRIRNSILPMARENINANVFGHIGALSRQAAEVFEYMELETDKNADALCACKDNSGNALGTAVDCERLLKLHPAIRKNLLRRAIGMEAGRLKDVEEIHIEDLDELLRKQSGKRISLPYGIVAIKEHGRILLTKNLEDKAELPDNVDLQVFDREMLGDDIPKEKDLKWFDFEKIGGWPVLRYPMDGDYLIIGREKHKKSLNRFMIDSKIPLLQRGKVPVLAVGNHVIWVLGYRQDDSGLITASTKKVLVARIITTEKVV